MRLSNVDTGHTPSRKAILFLYRFMVGVKAPDVVKTLLYRPAFFGEPHSRWTHHVMRGPSQWSVGERELFAAVVSKFNQCEF